MMKKIVLVTTSNREPERHTGMLWAAMVRGGAVKAQQTGSPDVAFARNMGLSAACNVLRNFADREVVVLIDDDMVCDLKTVETVAQAAIDKGRAVSAVYATQDAHLAGCRWVVNGEAKRDADGRSLWLTGLGLFAIPRALLLELESQRPSYKYKDRVYTAFCQTGVIDGEWWAEDYQLCANLGGVYLAPVGVGHIKKTPLWPDDETLKLVEEDQPLPGEDQAAHVRHADGLFPNEQDHFTVEQAAK